MNNRLMLLCVLLSFCVGINKAHAQIVLRDASGIELKLEKPVQRIISLAPHITENVFSAGAGDKLVGVVDYSDYPEAAKNITVIGSYNQINYEAVLALKPDIILAWQGGNGANMINRLRDLGLTVFTYEPKTLQSVADAIITIGKMAATEQAANQATAKYLQRIEAIKQHNQGVKKLRVFHQVWHSPLQTLSGEHILSDVFTLCGGENIFADENIIAPIVSREAVLLRNPELIFAAGGTKEQIALQRAWQKWQSIDAVKAKQLYALTADHIHRHTTRLALGAEEICDALAEARRYYYPLAVQD